MHIIPGLLNLNMSLKLKARSGLSLRQLAKVVSPATYAPMSGEYNHPQKILKLPTMNGDQTMRMSRQIRCECL